VHPAREVNRAHLLMALDDGVAEATICQVLGLGRTAVWRTRAAYQQGGLEFALHDEARPGQPRKYQTDDEAEVVRHKTPMRRISGHAFILFGVRFDAGSPNVNVVWIFLTFAQKVSHGVQATAYKSLEMKQLIDFHFDVLNFHSNGVDFHFERFRTFFVGLLIR
jgi:hypothetical protein